MKVSACAGHRRWLSSPGRGRHTPASATGLPIEYAGRRKPASRRLRRSWRDGLRATCSARGNGRTRTHQSAVASPLSSQRTPSASATCWTDADPFRGLVRGRLAILYDDGRVGILHDVVRVAWSAWIGHSVFAPGFSMNSPAGVRHRRPPAKQSVAWPGSTKSRQAGAGSKPRLSRLPASRRYRHPTCRRPPLLRRPRVATLHPPSVPPHRCR